MLVAQRRLSATPECARQLKRPDAPIQSLAAVRENGGLTRIDMIAAVLKRYPLLTVCELMLDSTRYRRQSDKARLQASCSCIAIIPMG